MYVTRNAWAQHMNNDHGGLKVWECMLCDLSTQFYSLESLESHLTCQHPGALREVRPFAEACMTTTSPQVVSCPLCSWAEDLTEPIDTETLIDHIAEHVHAFSLRSLPWASTIDRSCGEEVTRPDAQIEDWMSTISYDMKDLSLPQEPVTFLAQITKAQSQDVVEYMNALLNQALGKFSQSSSGIHETGGDYFAENLYFGEDDQESVVASAQQDDVSVLSIDSSSSGGILELKRESARIKWSYLSFQTAKTRARRKFWLMQWFRSAAVALQRLQVDPKSSAYDVSSISPSSVLETVDAAGEKSMEKLVREFAEADKQIQKAGRAPKTSDEDAKLL